MKLKIELTEDQKKKSDELCNNIIDTIEKTIDLEDQVNQALVLYTLWLLLDTLQRENNVQLTDIFEQSEKQSDGGKDE